MRTSTASSDPRRVDELHQRAGLATRRVANPKRLAGYLATARAAVSERWARYVCEGHSSGPLQKMFDFLVPAAVDPKASPEHLITAQRELLEECRFVAWVEEELKAELYEGLDRELAAEAAEDQASGKLVRAMAGGTLMEKRVALEAFVAAQSEESAVEERNVGLARVLARRLA